MPKATLEELEKLNQLLKQALLKKLQEHESTDGAYLREAIRYLRYAGVIADNRGHHGKTPKPTCSEAIKLMSELKRPPLGDQYDN